MNEEKSDKALEEFATNEISTLSPLMEKSLQLKTQADAVTISDKSSYIDAKATRRELSAHRTSVKGMRLALTRKLDEIKSQFIGKQEEVLAPVVEAELALKVKIVEYEEEQRRVKEAEQERIQKILDKLNAPSFDRKTVSRDEVVRAQAALKMELSLLDQKDRNKKVVKDHVAEQRKMIDELLEFVDERDRQAAEAKALAEERAKLEADKAEHEARVQDKAPVTGMGNLAPGVESTKNEDQAAKDVFDPENDEGGVESAFALVTDLGQDAMDEAVKVLGESLQTIEGQQLEGGEFTDWKMSTVEAIYRVIEKHQ